MDFKNTTYALSARQKRSGKFLLLAPVLLVPFMTLAFWGMGGGRGDKDSASMPASGLNPRLPDARLSDIPRDKLDIYQQSYRDSLKVALKAGKFRKLFGLESSPGDSEVPGDRQIVPPGEMEFPGAPLTSAQAGIRRQLAELDAMLSGQDKPVQALSEPAPFNSSASPSPAPLLTTASGVLPGSPSDSAPDPEMQQIQEILSTIQQIQQPSPGSAPSNTLGENQHEVLRPPLPAGPGKDQVHFGVLQADSGAGDPFPETGATARPLPDHKEPAQGFYSLSAGFAGHTEASTIRAVIHKDQQTGSQGQVTLRLLQDMQAGSWRIPSGTLIRAEARLQNNRLQLNVQYIRLGDRILRVKLRAFDLDGMPGIHIPGLATQDLKDESSRQLQGAMQLASLNSLTPSLGQRAAKEGIALGTRLIRKRSSRVRIKLTSGYQLLLREVNSDFGETSGHVRN